MSVDDKDLEQGQSPYQVDKLISEARRLAAEYRRATGKALPGVSGEVAEYDAARLLDLELCEERTGGFDAIGRGERAGRRVQIKARAIFDDKKSGQRVGQIKIEQEWDSVVLVLMDDNFEPFEIYEASRASILDNLNDSSRSKRGPMSVARFKAIGELVWSNRDAGAGGDRDGGA